MDYKSLGGGLTRVSTRPDIAVPGGAREYYVADALGSTRLAVRAGGAVTEQIDYDPYGRPTLGAPSTHQTWIGRQRDAENGLGDHGVRKYEPAEGRFHSVDPKWESFRSLSPYQYARNNPLNRVDANGQWDIVVHVAKDRSQNGYGVAVVTNRKGEEVFRFVVRVEGLGNPARYGNDVNPRDRMQQYGDTPLGVYDIPNGASKWRSDQPRKFGPQARLVLNETSGEIVESGRSAIRIHGKWKENPTELAMTHGCMRTFNNTMKQLKEVTDNLEATDPQEHGGSLVVIDDLEIKDGVPMIPGDAASTETPK